MSRKNAGILTAIVFGVFLRVWRIGTLSLWFDEGFTAWAINHSCRRIVQLLQADTAPPLYYLLLHGWSVMTGRSEIALRSFSAILGVATIPLVAAIANRVLIKPIAVVAATWLFVLSFPQIAYSQEARGYELSAFLAAVMMICLLRHIARPSWRWLGLLILAAAAAMYINAIMPWYVAAIAMAGLILPGNLPMRLRWRDGAIAAVCLIAAYLPWIGALRTQIHRVNQDFWIPPPTFDSVCDVLSQLCGVGHFWSWDQYVHWMLPNTATQVPRAAIAVVFAGTIAAVIISRGPARRNILAIATAALLVPLAMAVYSEFQRPIFFLAPLLPSTVFFPLLLASPLAWAPNRAGKIAVAIVMLLCAVNVWAYEKERDKEDWRSAAAAVAAMPAVPSRLIVFVANEAQLPFDYYYHRRAGEIETGAPAGFFDADPPRTQRRVLSAADLEPLKLQLASGHFTDVVLIDSHAGWIDPGGAVHGGYSDPEALTAKLILDSLRTVQRIDFPGDSSRHDIIIWRCAAN